jgi:hypothetical protein
MKKKSSIDFDAQCWRMAKTYFDAVDKPHMIGVIERSVELKNETE